MRQCDFRKHSCQDIFVGIIQICFAIGREMSKETMIQLLPAYEVGE